MDAAAPVALCYCAVMRVESMHLQSSATVLVLKHPLPHLLVLLVLLLLLLQQLLLPLLMVLLVVQQLLALLLEAVPLYG